MEKKVSVTNYDTVEKIQNMVDYFRTELFDWLVKKLQDEGFEGDVHLEALTILSSACLTYYKHISDTITLAGGTVKQSFITSTDEGNN